MFSLFYGIWQWLFTKCEYCILILGLDYAGKTTLLEQLKHFYCKNGGMDLAKIAPTVGLNIARIEYSGCKLLLWDLGGQTNLRRIWDKYYSETHALCFVIDSTDPSRFEEARQALVSVLASHELDEAPILICCNKRDQPNSIPSVQVGRTLNIESILRHSRHSQYYLGKLPPPGGFSGGGAAAGGHSTPTTPYRLCDISALNGDGIKEGFHWLIEQLKRRRPN